MYTEQQLSQKDLDQIYIWVDSLPLSKSKKNITRDFADGSMMAQTIHHYFPKTIDVHNYPPANSLKAKQQNWRVLNDKVLTKIGLEISQADINNLTQCKPMAIESLLHEFKLKFSIQEKDKNRQYNNKIKKNNNNMVDDQKNTLTKVQQLKEILFLLKEKVTFLQRNINKKDYQIKQLEEILSIQSKK